MSGDVEHKLAVVLVSGGLDSATVLAIARKQGFECFALTVDYGQRHRLELDAARQVSTALGAVEHRIVAVDLHQFGGSALTDPDVPVPDQPSVGIPSTYVPARNTVFLALALSWAETLSARELFIGANAVDYSGYPDCRPAFIAAFEALANVATRTGVEGGEIRVRAPLLHMSKAEIIRQGVRLGIDYSMTLSCYQPDRDGNPCGVCDSCRLRAKGFQEAGVEDPANHGETRRSPSQ